MRTNELETYDGRWNRSDLDYLALLDEWHVVARSSELTEDEPLARTLLGERLVLWRAEGVPRVWADACPHRGAPLSEGWIKQCHLVCPYHGWEYDAQGRRVHVPAHPHLSKPMRAPIRQFQVEERYGFVWLCLGQPVRGIPTLPHFLDDAYKKSFAGPYLFRANALRCVDNFIDASHFPFVHAGINGRPDSPDTTIDYQVIEQDDALRTSDFHVVQPDADARGVQLRVKYRYYCQSPTVAYSDKETGPDEHWFTWAALTPVDRDESKFWLVMCYNHAQPIAEADIQRRQSRIFEDGDRWIVESQRPVQMPLSVAAEMHVESDRLGVAYRRWLERLGRAAQQRRRGL